MRYMISYAGMTLLALVALLACGPAGSVNYMPFTPGPPTLTVTVTGNGTITSSPAGISCPGTCSAAFDANASVTLTATPASSNASSTVHGTGSELYAWGGTKCTGQATSGNCTMTLNVSSDAAATFTPKDSDVWWVSASGSDSGNDGRSRKTPYLTMHKVIPLMSPGDTVYIDDGTYTGQANSIGGYGGQYSTDLVGGTAAKSTRFYGYTRSLCAPNCASGTASATIDMQYNYLPLQIWRNSNIEIGYLRFLHSSGSVGMVDGSHNGSGSSLTVNCSGGAVSTVTVGAAGSGYPTNSSWKGAIWGGGISGADITVNTNAGGGISSVTVVNGGSGCTASTVATANLRASNIYIHDSAFAYALPGPTTANLVTLGAGRCNGCVFERNWAWGYGGRYALLLYAGANNVARGNILRYDGAPNAQPKAGLSIYSEDNSIAENNIVLDFRSDTDSGSDQHAAFFATCSTTLAGYPYALGTFSMLGNIAMASVGTVTSGILYDARCSAASGITGATGATATYRDNIVAGVSTASTVGGMWLEADELATTNGGHHTLVLDHNTIYGVNGGSLIRIDDSGWTSVTVTNNIVHGGAYSSDWCYRELWTGTPTASNNLRYACNDTEFGPMPGATNSDPAFQWLPNVTSGPAYQTGSDKLNIGATVVKKYVNGTLTGTDLWPFGNERLAADDMCATPDTGGASPCETSGNKTCSIYTRTHNTTGWCASGKTLTKYVWEQLGTSSPY